MDKLNKLGLDVLTYKKELSKDYPEIVKKSLEQTVNILAENNVIDVDVLYALTDKNTDVNNLNLLLLEKPFCRKTMEELLAEYEDIRILFNEYLGIDDNDNSEIKTVSNVNEESLLVAKNFMYGSDFAKEYFGISNQQNLKTLMNRQGVFEKFAILRLGKIVKDFIEESCANSEYGFDITFSDVFYENNKECYGIGLIFKIPIEIVEVEESMENISKQIQDLIDNSIKYFNIKMQP